MKNQDLFNHLLQKQVFFIKLKGNCDHIVNISHSNERNEVWASKGGGENPKKQNLLGLWIKIWNGAYTSGQCWHVTYGWRE
jgi:hypothetical protein